MDDLLVDWRFPVDMMSACQDVQQCADRLVLCVPCPCTTRAKREG